MRSRTFSLTSFDEQQIMSFSELVVPVLEENPCERHCDMPIIALIVLLLATVALSLILSPWALIGSTLIMVVMLAYTFYTKQRIDQDMHIETPMPEHASPPRESMITLEINVDLSIAL